MVEPYYRQITTPVCIVQGERDEIVPFTSAENLYKTLGSKKKKFIKSANGKHHICYSDDCDDWFIEVLEFMQDRCIASQFVKLMTPNSFFTLIN